MQCTALNLPYIMVSADSWHNLLTDVAVATGHAGIAGTTLSGFLCLAYCCEVAVQAPSPSQGAQLSLGLHHCCWHWLGQFELCQLSEMTQPSHVHVSKRAQNQHILTHVCFLGLKRFCCHCCGLCDYFPSLTEMNASLLAKFVICKWWDFFCLVIALWNFL